MTEAEKRKHRVCFTGHRPEKLTRHECQVIRGLEAAIKKAIADGYKVFISGMAPGVDIWAAEIVLQLRDKGADIKLICAIPFEGFETLSFEDFYDINTSHLQVFPKGARVI